MASFFMVRNSVLALSCLSFLFVSCSDPASTKDVNARKKIELHVKSRNQDSIFTVIDKHIYMYKNIAFCDMVNIGNEGCYLKDGSEALLHEYLPARGEEVLKIRAFNDSIIRIQRFNMDKHIPDTLSANMFLTGLKLYKSNIYDSLALIALEPFFSKDILDEYKKQNRWEMRNNFKWVIPPSTYNKN